MYNSVLLCRYILAKYSELGISINITKLMKTLYLVYGWILSKYGYNIINEQPEAWPSGPVFSVSRENVNIDETFHMYDKEFKELLQDTKLNLVIDKIISFTKNATASQMCFFCTQEKTAWHKTKSGNTIKDKDIIKEFSKYSNL